MHIETLILGSLGTNCYLVSEAANRPHVLVIDPADDAEQLLSVIGGRTVSAVLLTHGHFDHTGALQALKEQFPNAPICIHEADAAFLTDAHLGSGGFGIPYAPRPEATHLFKDGDTFSPEGFDASVTVLHTPGHTPGSCVYQIGDHWFTGDTLFRRGYGRYDLPGGDFKALIASLRKLLKQPGDPRVYPGHGDRTTLARERGML